MREGDILMGDKERARFSAMERVDRKQQTLKQVSEELGISLRQTKRIRKRYLEEGVDGLISRRRGKPSNRKISDETRQRVIDLLRGAYAGFGPTLASEKLKEREGLEISAETLRKWMQQEDLWKPKKRKEARVYQRRLRRSQFGDLLQGDGSIHDWFEGRAGKCVLLQFVDDATGRTTAARFFPTETTDGYLELIKEHIEKYGKPVSIYVDKHSIFRVNREELKKGIGVTHFGQVMKDLDIELICANSPQAKGRVERKHGVLQDRLVKELRLLGISSIEEGNAILPAFIDGLDQRFGQAPRDGEDAHRPLKEGDDLKKIFFQESYEGALSKLDLSTPERLVHDTNKNTKSLERQKGERPVGR